MKKLFALSLMVALVGCAEKKPLTPEEQWHGYCRSVGNAARSIIDEVYALPEHEIKTDVDAAREKVRAEFTEKCIATPHDKMPDYKPF